LGALHSLQPRRTTSRRSTITQNAAMRGEKIYEFEFDLTGVTDYGVSILL
jgi:hypothetical protein